jgi:glycosyltransferase involved in cell wall biosynthesis
MRVAIVAHSYQAKTKSNEWFFQLIRAHADTVDLIWDKGWIGGQPVTAETILSGDYDRVFVYQLPYVAMRLAKKIPDRVVFIPMYDAAYNLPDSFWKSLKRIPVLNLSWTLHSHVRKIGVNSLHTQYFPDPSHFKQVADFETHRGFFWLRRRNVGWPLISRLAKGAEWEKFHVHKSPDPDLHEPMTVSASTPTADEVKAFNLTFSKWMERDLFETVVDGANIFFAPRQREGIGMAFLEAMARGQCVVACNLATHSEYITDRVSGLLFDPGSPRELDFTNAEKLGRNARRVVERGHQQWTKDKSEKLPEFLFGSTFGHRSTDSLAARTRMAQSVRPTRDKAYSRVTVAVVTRNAESTLAETLRSISNQDYPHLEIVVVDGCSSDRTVAIIRDHEEIIDRWISEPDSGPYAAMNKAAELASGKWIIFMNAGDSFYYPSALSDAMHGAPDDADFIIGHHIYHDANGVEELHKASDFSVTWEKLTSPALDFSLLAGIPCHQATLTRLDTLRTHGGYRHEDFPIAADHDFMYRAYKKGAFFHHSDVVIANYFHGGFSSRNERLCHRDWYRLARLHGQKKAANRFFGSAFSGGIGWPELPAIFRETPFTGLRIIAGKAKSLIFSGLQN